MVRRQNNCLSQFRVLTSTSTTAFQSLDLGGAREVHLAIRDGFVAGKITNEPFALSDGIVLQPCVTGTPQGWVTVRSSDTRLFFASNSGATSILEVWIVRG